MICMMFTKILMNKIMIKKLIVINKILIVFDDMIADVIHKFKYLNISLVFIT